MIKTMTYTVTHGDFRYWKLQREWTAGPLVLAAFESDFTTGRGGLGNVITWAGGNGLQNNDNSNYDGYANARQTISVGAITNGGTQSYWQMEQIFLLLDIQMEELLGFILQIFPEVEGTIILEILIQVLEEHRQPLHWFQEL